MQMVALVAASLPGLAALGALLFTWMQVGQASKELRISEHGQITSRFNAAIENLGSQSLDVRLGGIYALQRIMQDSARDQPTIVSVLAAFAQRHAGPSSKSLKEPLADSVDTYKPKTDVQAAITTLARRRPERDSGTTIDLTYTDLRGLRFTGKASINLPEVDLSDADLRWSTLTGADLRRAALNFANLESAYLDEANLREVNLGAAKLGGAVLTGANLRGADMTCLGATFSGTGQEIEKTGCVDLQYAWLDDTDLRHAKMSNADLREANLAGADLTNADLTKADLTKADLTNADLTNAEFRGAKLTGAKLQGAKLTGARGLPREG